MKIVKKLIISVIFIFLSIIWIYPNNKSNQIEKFNPAKLIIEHISDSHKWIICGEGKNQIILDLPIIIWDNGIKFFMSYKFRENNGLVRIENNFYKILEDKIYKVSFQKTKNNEYKQFYKKILLDFSITKNVLMIFISTMIIIILFISLKYSYLRNSNIRKLLEPLILFIRNEIAIPNIGIKSYKKYLPFLLTIFFYIYINNLLGLFPNAPNITGNISITIVLGIITFFVININSNKYYWKHIFWMPDVPIIVRILLIPIELSGIFIKPITLAIRLFSNITAGHIIILSFISLIFVFKNIFFATIFIPFAVFVSLLEILVSFLQAFIFTSLSALFIGMSIEKK